MTMPDFLSVIWTGHRVYDDGFASPATRVPTAGTTMRDAVTHLFGASGGALTAYLPGTYIVGVGPRAVPELAGVVTGRAEAEYFVGPCSIITAHIDPADDPHLKCIFEGAGDPDRLIAFVRKAAARRRASGAVS